MATLRLNDLLSAKNAEYWLGLLLNGLRGIGVPILNGVGTASCVLTGFPTAEADIAIKITTPGALGVAVYVLSTDGGVNYAAPVTVPANGIIDTGLGVTATFGAGNLEPSFVLGDIWSFPLNQPSFAVDTWEPGDTGRTLVELDARLMEEGSAAQILIAKGGLIDEAQGEWLALLADQFYDVQKKRATFTVGKLVFTDHGAGPFTLSPGQFLGLSASGERFYNIAAFTLPLDGTVTIDIMAVSPGAASNVANGTIHTLVSVLAGVTIDNPAVGLTGTWITIQGTDDETDDSLRSRCKAQFPAQGPGSPAEVYAAVAIKASTEVTRVSAQPDGTVPGQVDIILAGPAGAVSGGAITAVQTAVDAECVPTTCSALCTSAVNDLIPITGTVYIEAAKLAAASLQIVANIEAHFQTIAIGGVPYPSPIIDMIQKVDGVRNVVLTAPTDPAAAVPANNVALPDITLVFTGV